MNAASPSLAQRQVPSRRVRTTTVLQMEAVECGAAALAIVLGYYGRTVSLEELRIACGVSRDGTNAGNMVKAARTYGMIARGFKKEPEQLPFLPLPQIVFWNFNHFVVVEGFGKGIVYLNDPAVGPIKVTNDEFRAAFTGVVLTFEPGPEFQRGGQRRGLITPLRLRLKGSEVGLLYVFLVSLALAAPGLAIPILGRIFVDYYLIDGMSAWVGPILLGLALTAFLRAMLTWMQQRALQRLETKLALTSSFRFFRHVLRLPVEFFTQRYGGEVGSRVEMNDRIAQLLSGELAANLLAIVLAVFYVAMMAYFDLRLTLVGVAFAGLNIVALRYVSRSRRDVNLRLLQERAKLTGTSLSGLQTIETLKATGSESDFFSRWAGYLAKMMTAEQKMGVYTLGLGIVPTTLLALNTVVILGYGSLRVINGDLTAGMLVAFQSMMISFLDPINQLVGLGGSLQEIEGELSRLDDVLRYPIDPLFQNERQTTLGTSLPMKLAGQLELLGVTYGYSRLDPPLITDFNLMVRPGDRIALVGRSASGKSTLAKLISGLYQPWLGMILLDGCPRNAIPRGALTNSLAMVDQDFFLCEGTVREVLTLWDSTLAEEDLIQAAKDACIHDDIMTRPGGYSSKVEEGGVNFSGGQRQRLEIARALVGNPSILILDEATSALDPVTEKRIDENLRRRGCTCVLVAHRLSTIRDCDEILVLDRGKIVQRGTHAMLQGVDGPYARLIRS
jgi:NHLM bacteriocin system ABC transporter peptidase/ATP-binding protein